MKLRGILLLLAFAFAASLGFSQTSGSGTTSTSTSTNVIEATVYAGGEGRQLLQAMPGSGTTIIPGVTPDDSQWQKYWPAILRCIPLNQILAAPNGHSKVEIYPIAPPIIRNEQSPNDKVCLTEYWPEGTVAYTNDTEIAEATVVGKNHYPEKAALMSALKDVVQKTNTRRVAIQRRSLKALSTKTLSGGFGGVGSATADNNIGGSGAMGITLGRSRTKNEDPVEFDIVALNDGPTAPPVIQKPPTAAKAEASTALPAQPPAPVVVPATVPTPTPAPQPVASCNLLDFTIHFARIRQTNVEGEELKKIAPVANWLNAHPSCAAQVEGHTCAKGSYELNAALGRERAKNVYEALVSLGVKKDQLIQFVSVGKDKTSTEYNNEDRRVILRVVGNSSGR